MESETICHYCGEKLPHEKCSDVKKPEPTELTTLARRFLPPVEVFEHVDITDVSEQPGQLELICHKLCKEIDRLTARINSMYVGELSPESRLNGYKVITDNQKKRIEELKNLLGEWETYLAEHKKVIDRLTAENKGLTKQLMEHGEALNVLSTLRQLYNLSPDMREPRVESAAKMMMRQSEEGLRLAHARTQEEYIKELQAELKAKDLTINLIKDHVAISFDNNLLALIAEIEKDPVAFDKA